MSNSIPASAIVQVVPGVISAGGNALALNAVMLDANTRIPYNTVQSFPSAAAVAAYFGSGSLEANAASIYFGGYLNSSVKPGALLFYQYNSTAISAFTRGASVAGLSLAQLQAITGTLSVTVDGTVHSTTSLSLSAATSFSNAASIIQTAISLIAPAAVTYDSVSGAFVITSGTTGTTSTITLPTGTAATALGFTGGVTSQGAAAQTPSGAMNNILAITANWASFMTLFDPDGGTGNTIKQQFAAWVAGGVANNNYVYVCWDVDTTPQNTVPASSSLGILTANESGVCLISSVDYTIAAFICGAIASINFNAVNGRATFAFKQSPSPLNGTITNQTVAANLIANNYTFYGAYATAAQGFTFFYDGAVQGEFIWLDAFVNQIWLNNSFQLNLMSLLTSVGSVPYDTAGYALLRAACMSTIQAGLNFGAFAPTNLSPAQIAEVNTAAGTAIDAVLSAQGWYLQVLPAPAATRAQRKSPPMNFWYLDAGSVQQISLNSVEVQ